jgi:hypothetical protein
MWGSGPSDVWAVCRASSNQVFHYDGNTWSVYPFAYATELHAVGGSAANEVWAAGAGGSIFHFDGAAWSKVSNSGTTEKLCGLYAVSPTDVWAVGSTGAIVHFNGSSWATSPSGTTAGLGVVRGTGATDVWAGGGSLTTGAVLRYNGTWSPVPGVPSTLVVDILPNSPSDVIVVGSGPAGHWEGSSWVTIDVGTTEEIEAVRLVGGEIWVVGAKGYSARAK